MQIQLNGTTRQVDDGVSLAELLDSLEIGPDNLAVEHNGAFIEKDRFESITLKPDDRLEIVRFVGGG